MRTAATLLPIITAMACLAQGKPVSVQPHWVPLDTRTVNTTITIKAAIGDSILENSTVASNFSVSVPEMRKDMYFLTLRSEGVAPPIADMHSFVTELPLVFRDSVEKSMHQAVSDLYASLNQGETRYKVGPTGELLETLDADKNMDAMRPKALAAANQLLALNRENKRRTAQEVDAHAHALADSLLTTFQRAQDQLQLLLDPYKATFPTTGSTRSATTFKSSGMPGLGGMNELPAVMESGLDELTPKSMTARTVITCDNEALLKAALALDPKSTLKKGDVSLVQETVYTMDRSTGWLLKESTEVRLRLGTLRALKATTSVVK